jgi:acyl-CoA synthetase (AMP-forming)/AMP-acid ligase II
MSKLMALVAMDYKSIWTGNILIWPYFQNSQQESNNFIAICIPGYGLTESSPAATVLETESTKYTSCGKPIPNTEMKVMNMDTKMNVGPGEPGEVCIRGPQVIP